MVGWVSSRFELCELSTVPKPSERAHSKVLKLCYVILFIERSEYTVEYLLMFRVNEFDVQGKFKTCNVGTTASNLIPNISLKLIALRIHRKLARNDAMLQHKLKSSPDLLRQHAVCCCYQTITGVSAENMGTGSACKYKRLRRSRWMHLGRNR